MAAWRMMEQLMAEGGLTLDATQVTPKASI
jgi:hypothetical protein